MKHARIVEKAPTRSGGRFWYVLTTLDDSGTGEKALTHAIARGLTGHPFSVHPDEKQSAIATLHAWARQNGWAIQEDPT